VSAYRALARSDAFLHGVAKQVVSLPLPDRPSALGQMEHLSLCRT